MNALIVIAETKLKEDCAARSAAWIDRGRIGEAPKRPFVRFYDPYRCRYLRLRWGGF